MSSKSGNPQQKRYHGSGNRENIFRNMDDRKRQGKSTENVGLVSKVEPLKPISCGHCGKPGHIITNCWKLGGKTPCEHCGKFNHKSELRLGNDQQPIKLQNSQILNDLGTKLSHLPLVQRKELAEVITQYRKVFPDVPSKTNLIEHDVDVGDSAPIKQHPYRVSPMKKELLDKEV